MSEQKFTIMYESYGYKRDGYGGYSKRVTSEQALDSLVMSVNRMLGEGWKLCGTPFITDEVERRGNVYSNPRVCQALTKD